MKTIVKKISMVLGLILILSLISCNEKTKVKVDEQDSKISEEIKSIEARSDSLEDVYTAILDEIDDNLDKIRDNQGYLVLGENSNADIEGTSKKEQILNNIEMINNLLKENKSKIASLEKNMSKFKTGKDDLLKSLEATKEKVSEQELQIAELRKTLSDKDFIIDDLNRNVAKLSTDIQDLTVKNEEQVTKMNKTYYACGTFKELKDKSIVEKEGGVFGIRRVKVISENLDKSEFTEMDMTKNTTIAVTGKAPKLITKHPTGTYNFEPVNEESDSTSLLTIKDPDNFWKVSKYLIVEVR